MIPQKKNESTDFTDYTERERPKKLCHHWGRYGSAPSPGLRLFGGCLPRSIGFRVDRTGVPHSREVELPVAYKGLQLNNSYRADFICFGSVIVEVKAVAKLSGVEEAQIINYLKATGYKVGLLVNFGSESLQYKRFVF